MFKLVIQDDEGKTTVVPLIRDEITIGRKEGNTIRLTERNVSRRHARIVRQNGEVQIEDLGSYNGIRVNNARIAERVALRVSDQVQIGDYKLYLKAEGVEQVDDARTVPIERIDTPVGNATDVLPAMTANGTPTVPLGVPQTPSPAALAAQAPAPNRSPVAVADTDPAGRPVASAAAVAALSPQGGHGKLVVVSSNFAGKELELTRPQMIIGRTDENDLVINHRSISRNHAKVVRDTDSGRYTISDLQSSNGVRVNGQDYGKVELRRGDVVDLGHVRLRFVEPGEDFVFARDAVITDVPETGGKKGLLVAVLLGVAVVGGIGVFVMTRGGGDKGKTVASTNGNGGGSAGDKAGGSADVATPGSGSDAVAAVGSGSGESSTPPPAIDAGAATAASDDVKLECLKLQADRNWGKLRECSDRLASTDGDGAKEFATKAAAEIKAELTVERMKKALTAENFKVAQTELEKIPDNSVYRREAEGTYEQAITPVIDDYERRAQEAAAAEKCAVVDKLVREATQKGVADKAKLVKCTVTAVAKNPTGNGGSTTQVKPPDPTNGGAGSGTTTQVAKPEACDADALVSKGKDHFGSGMFAAALQSFESSLKCKFDPQVVKLAYLAACRARNAARAKYLYGRMGQPGSLAQACLKEGIQVP